MANFYVSLIVYLIGHIPFYKITNSYDKKRWEGLQANYPNRKKLSKSELVLLEKIRKEANDNYMMWGCFWFLYFVLGAAYLFTDMEKFFI